MNLHYRPGMRSIKTVVAVFFTLLIGFCMNRTTTIAVASVSAIVCMRQNNQETMRFSAMRLVGTVLGGVIGFLAVLIGEYIPRYTQGAFLVVIPAFLILDLYLCNVLHIQQTSTISCIVVLLVAVNFESTRRGAILYALNRALDTLIGVGVALLVDLLIAPVKAGQQKREQEEEGPDEI